MEFLFAMPPSQALIGPMIASRFPGQIARRVHSRTIVARNCIASAPALGAQTRHPTGNLARKFAYDERVHAFVFAINNQLRFIRQ
jgi:hypothetical protein